MNEAIFRRCSRCVMDTTDPEIHFDADGVCNHCLEFDRVAQKLWFRGEDGKTRLKAIVEKIKAAGRGREYDCIMGLSGGVDSSYLALVMKEYGLRTLVVHVDAGWNSELAVFNIEQIVKYCGYDLFTHVIEWEEVRDLQVAYLKAGVANQDVIQDHAIFASIYHFASRNRIKYFISGGNISTESVLPKAWHHAAMDAINLRAIHDKFGAIRLAGYPTMGFLAYHLYYPYLRGISVVRPLNFLPYNKSQALEILKRTVGYKEYGRKHGESRFTKFFQNYYLPTKFGIDKRTAHLTSSILSGVLTRDQALTELEKPLYDPAELANDKSYVAKKLGLSIEELDAFVHSPGQSYKQFPNWDRRYKFMKFVRRQIETLLGRSIKTH